MASDVIVKKITFLVKCFAAPSAESTLITNSSLPLFTHTGLLGVVRACEDLAVVNGPFISKNGNVRFERKLAAYIIRDDGGSLYYSLLCLQAVFAAMGCAIGDWTACWTGVAASLNVDLGDLIQQPSIQPDAHTSTDSALHVAMPALEDDLEDKVTALKAALRASEKRVMYWQARCKQKEAELNAAGEEIGRLRLKGPGKRYLSARQGLEIAVRRTAANASATALGLVLAIDVHRTSLAAWEIRLRAATVASMRNWFQSMYIEMFLHSVQDATNVHVDSDFAEHGFGEWMIQIHGVRGDATNTCFRKRYKLHTGELHSGFIPSRVRWDDSWQSVLDRLEWKNRSRICKPFVQAVVLPALGCFINT